MPPRRPLAALAAAVVAACAPAPPPPVVAAPTVDAGPFDEPPTSILSRGFEFRCSADAKVGCSGVFPVRGTTSVRPPRVAVLRTGEEAFRARAQLLDQAKRSIRVQALIFRGDEAGLYFAGRMKQKRKEGVDVKVIVDAMSNLDVQTQWMYFDLKQHGIEVEGYEALYLNFLTADLSPMDPLRSNKRFHDKMWIIDAEDPANARAIVGGLNIANEYFRLGTVPINKWRDQDVLLDGEIVDDVAAAFDRNYDYFKGLKTRLPKAFNPDNSWRLTRVLTMKVKAIKVPTWPKAPIVEMINRTLATPPMIEPVAAKARFVQSRPRFGEDYIKQVYEKLIEDAQDRVLIANAYFVPSKVLVAQLKSAARRGVHVRILTNSPETNDIAPVATLSRSLYADLLAVNAEASMVDHVAAGRPLEIWEWVGEKFDEGTLHAKFAVVDETRVIVGSYNLDPRSEKLNSETAVLIDSAPIAHLLATEFVDGDLQKSRRVSAAEAALYKKPKGLDEKFELLFSMPMKEWL